MEYGYIRVSSISQNLDRQIDDMYKQGLTDKQIFADKLSGKDFDSKFIDLSKPKQPIKNKKQNVNYHLTGQFVDKVYKTKIDLLNDLQISAPTLKKYFNGKETIIQKMKLKIIKQEKNWREKHD